MLLCLRIKFGFGAEVFASMRPVAGERVRDVCRGVEELHLTQVEVYGVTVKAFQHAFKIFGYEDVLWT